MSNIDKQGKVHINHYPGHMAKTKRLIKENIKLIDLVYEATNNKGKTEKFITDRLDY